MPGLQGAISLVTTLCSVILDLSSVNYLKKIYIHRQHTLHTQLPLSKCIHSAVLNDDVPRTTVSCWIIGYMLRVYSAASQPPKRGDGRHPTVRKGKSAVESHCGTETVLLAQDITQRKQYWTDDVNIRKTYLRFVCPF